MLPASKQRPSGPPNGRVGVAGGAFNGAERVWHKRVFRNYYTRGGQRYFLNGWSVKIQHHGVRHTFSLRAKNKAAAATEARHLHEAILTEGWEATLGSHSGGVHAGANGFSKTRLFWENHLLVQRHPFPASGGSEKDLIVWIEQGGTGYWFPLGTSDSQIAAARAQQIYQSVLRQSWAATCRAHSREMMLGFEWCSEPVLWTYTTVHTLVGAPRERMAPVGATHSRRVLIVEEDAGVCRALQWCVCQQPGFSCISCSTGAECRRLVNLHKPCLVLLNRDLARSAGITASDVGRIARIQAGVHVVTYLVRVDGDQLFVSTPSRARGYLFRRVDPRRVLAPLLQSPKPLDLAGDDLLRRVKSFFRDLLMPDRHCNALGLPRLTHREREVLVLLSRGCVDKEIAEALGITAWTVHGHVKSLFQRLGVRTRTEAVIRYFEQQNSADNEVLGPVAGESKRRHLASDKIDILPKTGYGGDNGGVAKVGRVSAL